MRTEPCTLLHQRTDSNLDHVCTLLQNGSLQWYGMTLNDVIHKATEVKLNCQSSWTWTTDDGTANFVGKEGSKRPSSSDSHTTSDATVMIDHNVPSYC